MQKAKFWLYLWVWTFLAWIILTWTKATENMLFGLVAAAVVAALLAPLGDVMAPWRLLAPRRLWLLMRTLVLVTVNMVKANLSLTRRIWSPHLRLRPGMVVVTTRLRSDGGLAAVGLLTSLIVDNQIVDLDRRRHRLQYHGVWLDSEDPAANRRHINGPLEAVLSQLSQ